jgi:cation transport ATPase
MNKKKRQIRWILLTGILMLIGLILLKYIPMAIYGKNILFDASAHIVWTIFILYIGWFFIDQSENLRIFYIIIGVGVIVVMAIQRILANEHNEVGIFSGLLISFLGIIIPRWKEFKKNIDF